MRRFGVKGPRAGSAKTVVSRNSAIAPKGISLTEVLKKVKLFEQREAGNFDAHSFYHIARAGAPTLAAIRRHGMPLVKLFCTVGVFGGSADHLRRVELELVKRGVLSKNGGLTTKGVSYVKKWEKFFKIGKKGHKYTVYGDDFGGINFCIDYTDPEQLTGLPRGIINTRP